MSIFQILNVAGIEANSGLFVSSAGLVAVGGFTTPSANLNVRGTIGSNVLQIEDSSTNVIAFIGPGTNSGVAIGSSNLTGAVYTNPKLVLNTGTDVGLMHLNGLGVELVTYMNSSDSLIGNASNHDLALITNNTEVVKITAGGNVGINHLTPPAKLTIVGSGSSSSTTTLAMANSSAFSLFNIRDDGKFNLGVLSSSFDLACVTVGYLATTTATRAIAIGPQTTANSYSVIIGDTAIDGGTGFNVGIGAGVQTNGVTNVVLGAGSVVTGSRTFILGTTNTISSSDAIVLGYNTNSFYTSPAGSFVVGSANVFGPWLTMDGTTSLRTFTIYGTDASVGSQTNSSALKLKSSYYTTSPNAYDFDLKHVMDTTSPTSHVEFSIASSEKMRITSAGDVVISQLAGTGNRVVEADSTGKLIAGAAVVGSAASKVAFTFTPGTVGSPNTVTHGLGTTDIIVTVWDVSIGDIIYPKVDNRTTSSVDVTFTSNPAGNVRIVIVG